MGPRRAALAALWMLVFTVVFTTGAARADAGADAAVDAAGPDRATSNGATDAAAPDAAAATSAAQEMNGKGKGAPQAAGSGDTPPRHLRVAVAGSPPFVITGGDGIGGIAVDVFRESVSGAGFVADFIPMKSVPIALDAVARHEVDAAIGPISITAERAERVRFTQPYFQSTLGILARRSAGTLFERLAPFFSRTFVVGLAVLLGVLGLVGTLIWLAERKKNAAQFPVSPPAGVANGIWFALVTMTTVGYGDRAPITIAGRIIAAIWMVIALITASSLTAGIATTLTLARLNPSQIETAEQLTNRRVATVRGTPGVNFARRANARVVLVDTFADGVQRLVDHDVDAVVFDRPMLRYHLRNNPELDLIVARASYVPQGYGFAVPLDSDLQHPLNVALLRANELGLVKRALGDWLGAPDDGEP